MSGKGYLLPALLVAGMYICGAALAQGFAGLGTDAEGFAIPSPETELEFPRDHGPHPLYRLEWWYVTANLHGEDGKEYGVQWTLFRSALAPGEAEGWQSPQIWFAHAAVTSPDSHAAAERFARGGTGQAGAVAEPFSLWIDDWRLKGNDIRHLRMTAQDRAFSYDLALQATGPIVLHGDRGYSVKSAGGQASHYYSQPFYEVEGVLLLPEGAVSVRGSAWMDREWSSQPLAEDQAGWDWFSLSFDTGEKLMGFSLRSTDGSQFTSASWISPEGKVTPYGDGALTVRPIRTSKVAGREIPTNWSLSLPDQEMEVTVEALNANAWMNLTIPYWEGPVRIRGTHAGRGYLEMTGYEFSP